MSRPYENILTMINNENCLHNVAYGHVRRTVAVGISEGNRVLRSIYVGIGNPLVEEVLQCDRDAHNAADRY